jgi:hypothetical protein
MKCRAGRRPFVDTYEEHNQRHFAYLATTGEIWDASNVLTVLARKISANSPAARIRLGYVLPKS